MHNAAHRIGVLLAIVQFFFTLTWTIYASQSACAS
jgi:hypothetical protein